MRSKKLNWCLPALLGAALIGSTTLARADEIFRDDFTRVSNEVGNGWEEIERDASDVSVHGFDATTAVLELRDRRTDAEPDAAAWRLISTEGYNDLTLTIRYIAFSWSANLYSGHDALLIQYTTDGGSTWLTADSRNLVSTSWIEHTVSLPGSAGGQVNFGLRLALDINETEIDYLDLRGLMVDYLTVSGGLAPDTTAPHVSGVAADDVEFPADAILVATATDTLSNIESADYSRDGTGWVPMSATDDAFDEQSEGLTATLSNLFVKTYEVCVRATDVNDKTSDGTTCDLFDVKPAKPGINFAGPLLDTDGLVTTELRAEVTGPCSNGSAVEFLANSGGGFESLGTASVEDGVARYSTELDVGIYDIKVKVGPQDLGGDSAPECSGAEATGITVVADVKASSTGGGWYKVPVESASQRVSFGYTAQTKYDKRLDEYATSGSLLWIHQDTWRLKGVIDAGLRLPDDSCPDGFVTCAAFTGEGTLYRYNADYDPDCVGEYGCEPEWISPIPNSRFIFFVREGGVIEECLNKKKCKQVEQPDQFGIEIAIETLDAESEPVYLNGGNLVVR